MWDSRRSHIRALAESKDGAQSIAADFFSQLFVVASIIGLLLVWRTPRQAHSGYPSFAFEVEWALVADRRVPPGRVVEAFDIIEHVGPGFIP